MDRYSLETITILKEAFQRLRGTPLASSNLLIMLREVIDLAEVELDTDEE